MEKKELGCAIEAEPKTLRGGELVNAREAARVIMESKKAEEASAIFTAGLRSVVSIEAVEKRIQRRDRLHDLTRICRAPMPAAGSRARALPGNPLLLQEYPPDHTQITEPSSAPF